MSSAVLNIGDKVRVREGARDFWCDCGGAGCQREEGSYLVIRENDRSSSDGQYSWDAFKADGKKHDYCSGHNLKASDFIILNPAVQSAPIPTLMENIYSTFKNLFVSEPQKTFQKAGITNANGDLTGDGTSIFLSYLLQKNDDAFKTEIVDRILAEQEANKK